MDCTGWMARILFVTQLTLNGLIMAAAKMNINESFLAYFALVNTSESLIEQSSRQSCAWWLYDSM